MDNRIDLFEDVQSKGIKHFPYQVSPVSYPILVGLVVYSSTPPLDVVIFQMPSEENKQAFRPFV